MDETSRATERMWTPWRLSYASGGAKEDGCIFCNRLHRRDDVTDLILHRGKFVFVIMNLYPYNTGHVMIVPNRHASDPADLDDETLCEMATLLPRITMAQRRAFRCDGFNVGLNIGAIAGAGVAEHLHQHVVPRWLGDANFMPILASTMTIPELIPVTYAKLRAELSRVLHTPSAMTMVALSANDHHALTFGGTLPRPSLVDDEPVLHSALQTVPAPMRCLDLTGWAGSAVVDGDAEIALTFRAQRTTADVIDGWEWTPVEDLAEADLAIVNTAIAQRAPAVAHHYADVLANEAEAGKDS